MLPISEPLLSPYLHTCSKIQKSVGPITHPCLTLLWSTNLFCWSDTSSVQSSSCQMMRLRGLPIFWLLETVNIVVLSTESKAFTGSIKIGISFFFESVGFFFEESKLPAPWFCHVSTRTVRCLVFGACFCRFGFLVFYWVFSLQHQVENSIGSLMAGLFPLLKKAVLFLYLGLTLGPLLALSKSFRSLSWLLGLLGRARLWVDQPCAGAYSEDSDLIPSLISALLGFLNNMSGASSSINSLRSASMTFLSLKAASLCIWNCMLLGTD